MEVTAKDSTHHHPHQHLILTGDSPLSSLTFPFTLTITSPQILLSSLLPFPSYFSPFTKYHRILPSPSSSPTINLPLVLIASPNPPSPLSLLPKLPSLKIHSSLLPSPPSLPSSFSPSFLPSHSFT